MVNTNHIINKVLWLKMVNFMIQEDIKLEREEI